MISDLSARAALWLRRHAPERLKIGLRAARLVLKPVPPPAPELAQWQLDGAILLSSRLEMLRRLPKGGTVCELGTLAGDFARAILDECLPSELHLVDVSFEACRADVLADPRVRAHQMLTVRYLHAEPEARFDWIYVDADHSYEAVMADIAAARDKVRPGGLLIFNDFARMIRPGLGTFGVHQAVMEFAARDGWRVAYLCLQGEALYDIALRRPEHPAAAGSPHA